MITGGAGFIGSHLCDEFVDNENQVIVLTRNSSSLDNLSHLNDKLIVERVDITDYDRLGAIIEKYRPEVIIHLAGETSHSKSFENPLYDLDVNSKSTLYILEKIRQIDLKCRFILGSTFIVIGKPLSLPVNEESECNPTTIYGTNKLASEIYCKIYHNVYGIDTLIFRITNSFGPREKYVANKNAINFLIYKASKGEEITIYDEGNFFRDLVYVSDVISAIKVIMQKGKSGNLYWISSGKQTWFYEFGTWLEDLTNAKVKYIESTQYNKKVDVGNFLVDNQKLRSLGWNIKTPVKEGIKKTLAYFETIK